MRRGLEPIEPGQLGAIRAAAREPGMSPADRAAKAASCSGTTSAASNMRRPNVSKRLLRQPHRDHVGAHAPIVARTREQPALEPIELGGDLRWSRPRAAASDVSSPPGLAGATPTLPKGATAASAWRPASSGTRRARRARTSGSLATASELRALAVAAGDLADLQREPRIASGHRHQGFIRLGPVVLWVQQAADRRTIQRPDDEMPGRRRRGRSWS